MRLRWAALVVVAISALGGIALGRTDVPDVERFSDFVTDGAIGSVAAAQVRLAPATPEAIPVSASLTLQPDDLSALSQPAVDYLGTREPQWGVAVALPASGTVYESNATESFAMASVTKIVIMATLLAHTEHGQHALTASDRQLLTTMITESDNDSAITLWDEAGGAQAISAFLAAKGIWGITPADASLSWGDSTATPAALVQLLSKLWAGVLLSPHDTTYALQLMTAVVPEQRWGVSAGMPNGGAGAALKDGWYDAITGWRVSSVGIDTSTATPIIAVIMTRNQQSLEYAQATIEARRPAWGRPYSTRPVNPMSRHRARRHQRPSTSSSRPMATPASCLAVAQLNRISRNGPMHGSVRQPAGRSTRAFRFHPTGRRRWPVPAMNPTRSCSYGSPRRCPRFLPRPIGRTRGR